MLKDLFEEKKPKEEENDEVRRKALIYLCIIIVGFALLFVGGKVGKTNNTKKDDIKVDEITIKKEELISRLDLIKDNYEILIYKVTNEDEKKLEIKRDKDLTIYYGTALNIEGYIEYKNNIYIPGSETFKLAKKGEVINDIPNYIYNFDLIKKVTNYCTFKDNNTCEINVSEYLNEYNNIYLDYEFVGDIEKILKRLKEKNIIVGVVTNSTKEKTERKLKKYINLLDFIYCDANKPSIESINDIINKYQVSPNEIIFIGDSDSDYQTSKNAKIDFCGVNTGKNKWYKTDAIFIESINDLEKGIL